MNYQPLENTYSYIHTYNSLKPKEKQSLAREPMSKTKWKISKQNT